MKIGKNLELKNDSPGKNVSTMKRWNLRLRPTVRIETVLTINRVSKLLKTAKEYMDLLGCKLVF